VKDKEEDSISALFDGLLHPDLLHDIKKLPEGKNFAHQLQNIVQDQLTVASKNLVRLI
jgi:hypothetical protein